MARILYKYLDIKGAKGMIGNQNLQFTNASQLNDPFDCHPRLMDYSAVPDDDKPDWVPKEWWQKKRENDALNRRNETWLCSLSKVCDSILMWSHYCYSHKGVCIGLDIDKVMASVPPMFGSLYLEPFVIDVQYQDIIERPDAYQAKEGLYLYQWRTKAKEWEYEQEVRLVMPKPSPEFAPKEMWDGREIRHYLPLKGECYESIYFGVHIDPAERDNIMTYAREKLNPQIKFYQMHVDDNAFRLKPEIL